MTAVFNTLVILLVALAVAALGFEKDNVFIIIPSLMFSGYMVAVLYDVIMEEWDRR